MTCTNSDCGVDGWGETCPLGHLDPYSCSHMGPEVTILDDLPPEDGAMLQALYSRSPARVKDHLSRLKDPGASGGFMSRYYVGYGHQSIGDCGTTTIFIEGVPLIVAKAIQDWPLYSGQEASTRYMDFSKVPFHNPLGSEAGRQVQEEWRKFYMAAKEPLLAQLRAEHPPQRPHTSQGSYERALSALAFDILRGFLPAGAHTNLSWHTNLRQAQDHLEELRVHPDAQVARTAAEVLGALTSRYPHSFKGPREGRQEYLRDAWDGALLPPTSPYMEGVYVSASGLALSLLHQHQQILRSRPKGALIPRHVAAGFNFHSRIHIDYGSWRDLQRHRAGHISTPLLTDQLGFHPWYLGQLGGDLYQRAEELLETQRERIRNLTEDPVPRQYYLPLGSVVEGTITQDLRAMVYRVELRSGRTVHPTLRAVALEEARWLQHYIPWLPLHVDWTPVGEEWTERRGKQTILDKTDKDS